MSDRWPRYPGEDELADHHIAPTDRSLPGAPVQRDPLADPTDEEGERLLTPLLPRGPAWGTADGQALDGDSRLARFWRAIGVGFGDAYRALYAVAQESTAVTLDTSLPDWEADYGLPDPCLGPDQTFDQRLRSLLMKIRSGGTITPVDLITLAGDAGYEITIEEPTPFRMGASTMGGEEALSGGEPVELVWIVSVPNVPVDYFRMGDARMGFTPLGALGLPDDLLCLFRAVKPAWTILVFRV